MPLILERTTPELLAKCERVRNSSIFGDLPGWARRALETGTRQDRAKAIDVANIMSSPSYNQLSNFMRGAVEAGDTRFFDKARQQLATAKIRKMHAEAAESARLRQIFTSRSFRNDSRLLARSR